MVLSKAIHDFSNYVNRNILIERNEIAFSVPIGGHLNLFLTVLVSVE